MTGHASRWLFRSWQLVCLVCFTGISLAQTAIIKGKVKDHETNLPLATIVLSGQKVFANAAGEFAVSVDSGNHRISITHAGYSPIEQMVTVRAGETRLLQFIMMRDELLDDVVVLGSRSEIHRSSLNTAVPIDVFYGNICNKLISHP